MGPGFYVLLLVIGWQFTTFAIDHEPFEPWFIEDHNHLPDQDDHAGFEVHRQGSDVEERQLSELTFKPATFDTLTLFTPIRSMPSSTTSHSTSTVPLLTFSPRPPPLSTTFSAPSTSTTESTSSITSTITPPPDLEQNPDPAVLTTTFTAPHECTTRDRLTVFTFTEEGLYASGSVTTSISKTVYTYIWQNYPFPASSLLTEVSCYPSQVAASMIAASSMSAVGSAFRLLVCPFKWVDYGPERWQKKGGEVLLKGGYHVCCPRSV